MTTTTTTTATGTILAVDRGKSKRVACAYDPATRQARFDSLTTACQPFRKRFARYHPTVVLRGGFGGRRLGARPSRSCFAPPTPSPHAGGGRGETKPEEQAGGT